MKVTELLAEAGASSKIVLEPDEPGKWISMSVLVDGKKAYRAVRTIGPGSWEVFVTGDTKSLGSAGTKTEIKAIVKKHLNLDK